MRSENRARFPATSELVDQFRAAGIEVKVRHVREGGNEAGDAAYSAQFDAEISFRPKPFVRSVYPGYEVWK